MNDRTLCGELVAALGAAALQERAALSGTHAATKAMLAFPAAIVWLIGTFHDEVSQVGEVAVDPPRWRNAASLGQSRTNSTLPGQRAKTRAVSRKTE